MRGHEFRGCAPSTRLFRLRSNFLRATTFVSTENRRTEFFIVFLLFFFFSSLEISFYRCFLPGSFETFRMWSNYCQYTGYCILESSNSKGLAKRKECYGKFVDKRCVTELQRSNRTYEVDDDRFSITAHESRPCYGVGVVRRLFITW